LPTNQSRLEKVQADRSSPEEALEPWIAHGPKAPRRRGQPATSGRPDPAGIRTDFLREKLARGPVPVTDLAAMARASGLLGEGHLITDAKPFKRAKEFLDVRSVRNGFGSWGEWLWLLEKQPTPLVAEPLGPRIPSGWIEGVARLDYHRPPTDIPAHRWRQFLSDCNNFLASSDNWAERAAKLGWDALTLFGCRRHRPLVHPGSAGLLWAINGGRLVELHRDWAVVELAGNGSQRIFERRRVAVHVMRIATGEKTEALADRARARLQLPAGVGTAISPNCSRRRSDSFHLLVLTVDAAR
jgi:hypothetical protein